MQHGSAYVAIMAGGIGSRFWPKSRTAKPKQFLDILNVGRTLLQLTYDRFLKLVPPANIYVVTIEMYEGLVKEQLPDLTDRQILKEPMRRNTAPCITYACDKIFACDKNATVIVSPSDHLILHEDKFMEVMEKCLAFVSNNSYLVTLGIKPVRPATGYGYIQFQENGETDGFYKVKTFTEKPTIELARTFIKSGDFLWNSGIFVWKARTLLSAIAKHLPEVAELFREGHHHYDKPTEQQFIREAYSQCTNISIDYGVMEKADNVYTLPAAFGWSDIGSWDALYEAYPHDYLGNAVAGKNVKIYDAAHNMIMVPDDKLVVVQGLDGYCVIDTNDVLLICQKDKEQEVKQITVDLKVADMDKFL
ncbi:MAG: sugar phosphate nucleotidyltransferase [Chitinophagales bacterium]|nr:sugar phosphate nucleotidyltransferase [Chitinophagales bacterium]MDW8418889.1 mannose-1-phosphate guanylyltransferase [Chitinophagales bacterium]